MFEKFSFLEISFIYSFLGEKKEREREGVDYGVDFQLEHFSNPRRFSYLFLSRF